MTGSHNPGNRSTGTVDGNRPGTDSDQGAKALEADASRFRNRSGTDPRPAGSQCSPPMGGTGTEAHAGMTEDQAIESITRCFPGVEIQTSEMGDGARTSPLRATSPDPRNDARPRARGDDATRAAACAEVHSESRLFGGTP
jgi:hypothetical protein